MTKLPFSLPQDLYDKGALSQKRVEFLRCFTSLVNVFLPPLILYVLYQGAYLLFAIEILFIVLINIKTYRVIRDQTTVVSYTLIIVVLALALILATYFLGVSAALWSYPILAAIYFVVPTKKAHLITLCIVSPITLVIAYNTGAGFAFRYAASIVSTMFLANKIVEIVTELQANLLESSIKDPLTGAYNRRYMDIVLKQNIQQFDRDNLPMSLLIFDIDFFKRVNDSYGHDIGDVVLQHVVAKVISSLRANDLVFRLGGEEFIVLFHNTKLDAAALLAEKLRHELATIKIKDSEQRITVSIGVSLYRTGYSKEEWLKVADKCLYKAKKEGRNNVILCTKCIGDYIPEHQLKPAANEP